MKCGNKAFKMLKRNQNYQNPAEYKKSQANVRKTIKMQRGTVGGAFAILWGERQKLIRYGQ